MGRGRTTNPPNSVTRGSTDDIIAKVISRCEEKATSLRKSFRQFDTDGSGRVSINEFRVGLQVITGITLSDVNFAALLKVIDKDGDGLIDIVEFAKGMRCASPKP
jgi:Ca2+-binding EF-hand superfamily protein